MRAWTKFEHDNLIHEQMLDDFLKTPGMPAHMSTREGIKIAKFREHPASEFYMLVVDDKMVGCCGFYVLHDDNGILYCKSPYRLYILPEGNGAYTANRTSWENITKDWLSRNPNIPFLATVNVGNEKILYYEIIGMQRYTDRLPEDDTFRQNQKSFYLHPKLVKEMYTWQYAWYTTNYVGFQREEMDMDPEVKKTIEDYWAKGYWLGKGNTDRTNV